MGFSIKEIIYKNRYLLYLTDQELAGPWFSFKLKGKSIGTVPVILKNIEPTPIYQLVNSRTGLAINRITFDFDIREYLKRLIIEGKLEAIKFRDEQHRIRVYIDIFIYPKVPFIIAFVTVKNNSDFNLHDLSMYFVFDLDINGLQGFDNDFSGYDQETDTIYQYDPTGLYGGFSTLSKATHFESCLTKDFKIDLNQLNLKNQLYKGSGEILSALQNEFMTVEPDHSFQSAIILTGGFSREELLENIKQGKGKAMKYLKQVNRNIRSEQRNEQEAGFIKINLQQSKDCNKP
ncbi:MAG: hypothetical protein ACTSR8_13905 [Promethearchaeota archaeon]